MGTRNVNTNVAVAVETAKRLGATVLAIKNARNHHAVQIRTKDDVVFWHRISMGYVDPYKMRGWIRQAINSAGAKRDHAREIMERRNRTNT